MRGRVLMVQGTGSSVGKSLLVAGLCRLFQQDGLRVAPFKAQNMALNAFVTSEGHEVGRAQAVQAEAAGVPPHVDMNPILLKPEGNARSQVVVMGKPWRSLPAATYYQHRRELWPTVTAALDRLRARHDLVIIEGAGSPAEINLRPRDIVNMAVALHAQAPVLLVGDIERGGVFASLIGTLILLAPEEQRLVKGLIINKFRGDLSLLQDGLRMIEERAGKPVLGVVPFVPDLAIAEEDSLALEQPELRDPVTAESAIDIAVVRLPRVSNFDDVDALRLQPGVRVRFVTTTGELGRPHAVILPGSKNTLDDLVWLRQRGLEQTIRDLARTGTAVVGICGGYQMLGQRLSDPHAVDGYSLEGGDGCSMPGLGLLPVDTVFQPQKRTLQVKARVVSDRGFLAPIVGCEVEGYEIHMGETQGGQPLFEITGTGQTQGRRSEGAVDKTGRIMGTYLHGVFDTPAFREAWLRSLGWQGAGTLPPLRQVREAAYKRLAGALRDSLDVAQLREIIDHAL